MLEGNIDVRKSSKSDVSVRVFRAYPGEQNSLSIMCAQCELAGQSQDWPERNKTVYFDTFRELYDHLLEHVSAGHTVPVDLLERVYYESISDFAALVGGVFPFYGVDTNCFKLGLSVWQVMEDPSDGYRSYMDTVLLRDPVGIYSPRSLADVRIGYIEANYEEMEGSVITSNDFSGYTLTDVKDGHLWLAFGNDDYNDYYPMFLFKFFPKEPTNE